MDESKPVWELTDMQALAAVSTRLETPYAGPAMQAHMLCELQCMLWRGRERCARLQTKSLLSSRVCSIAAQKGSEGRKL